MDPLQIECYEHMLRANKAEKLQFLKTLFLAFDKPEDFKPVQALYKNRMNQLVKKQRISAQTFDSLKPNTNSNLNSNILDVQKSKGSVQLSQDLQMSDSPELLSKGLEVKVEAFGGGGSTINQSVLGDIIASEKPPQS